MELGIDGHRHQPGIPDPVQCLEIFRAILHDDSDPIPRLQAIIMQQTVTDTCRPLGKLAIAGMHRIPMTDSAGFRPDAACPDQQMSKVH